MSLTVVTGDLFDDDAQALVNAVNCQGVMGAGVALEFRHRFPLNYLAYQRACQRGDVRPGRVLAHREAGRWVINVPTKRNWRDRSTMEDVRLGIEALVEELGALRLQSVALPALGCGLGGLPWSEVRSVLVRTFRHLPSVEARVYAPMPGPPARRWHGSMDAGDHGRPPEE